MLRDCNTGLGRTAVASGHIAGGQSQLQGGETMVRDEMLHEMYETLKRIEERGKTEADKPLNLPEAAAYLSISKSSLYRQTSKGEIAYCKPNGKKLYFLKRDLNAWVQRHRKKSNAELAREINEGAAPRLIVSNRDGKDKKRGQQSANAA
jgi:excisionase family DNA binding protein